MKKTFTLFFAALMCVSFTFAGEGGTLTPDPNPIIPNQSVTINYDGTGTNFATWQPQCFIHVWLIPKSGQTFTGNYAPAWATCNGDQDYLAIDSKYKMTYSGTAGKYSIIIPNLFAFFGVLDADKSKVAQFGIIVRAQYTGTNNQTNDFLLNVTDPNTTGLKALQSNILVSTQMGKLKVSYNGIAQAQLYTLTGQLVRATSFTNQFEQTLKSGAYILQINNETHKVLVP